MRTLLVSGSFSRVTISLLFIVVLVFIEQLLLLLLVY